MFLIKLLYYHDNINDFKSFMFGKYNGFASKARGFCMHVFLVMLFYILIISLYCNKCVRKH